MTVTPEAGRRHDAPATFEQLVELVDRQVLEITVWQRLLAAASAADPRERGGLPEEPGLTDHVAVALARIRRAFALAAESLPPTVAPGEVLASARPDPRVAYARWLIVRDVHPAAEHMLALLRPSLRRYPTLVDLDKAQRSARAAVLSRTPAVYAGGFLRPAYLRHPLRTPLTGAERFELALLLRSVARFGCVVGENEGPEVLVHEGELPRFE